ncbi:hypothetical protein [Paraburkholderia sp. BL10I2N1]|uniref:hypothetical protein n=1 Tax=Paraburkholderia sp. BL10I2N1 TaxID=1938796 RepID=UPI00106146DF|nr:hypothetical protein [Paraburkholderia sp. BL10I2N1]TDN70392.1 hypothetical protein B0G77_3865 [Paraburkholderia sp. BL10I2N1]
MPKILERLEGQLEKKGMGKSQAAAVATSSLQKNGVLKKGTQQLTPKGEARNSMTAAERARDRAAKAAGKKPADYTYNQMKNTARLKK